jgi:thiosulfate reductase cytochrome b subunit
MSTQAIAIENEKNGEVTEAVYEHPLVVRLCHWVNAVSLFVMVGSGLQIFRAFPSFGAKIPQKDLLNWPKAFAIGGWLGGALQWHFAAMWLLAVNGLVYLVLNAATGRVRRRFWPLSPRQFVSVFGAALHGHLSHDDLARYNAVQKAAYVGAVVLLVVMVLSGLVLWKSVQFPWLRTVLGGYEGARLVHFLGMSGLVLFFLVHVTMVALVPRTLRAMTLGR